MTPGLTSGWLQQIGRGFVAFVAFRGPARFEFDTVAMILASHAARRKRSVALNSWAERRARPNEICGYIGELIKF